jgi:hypothetical protein
LRSSNVEARLVGSAPVFGLLDRDVVAVPSLVHARIGAFAAALRDALKNFYDAGGACAIKIVGGKMPPG